MGNDRLNQRGPFGRVRVCAMASSSERVRDALHQLDLHEDLGAVVFRDDEATLAEAARVDAKSDDGTSWAGRPITIKDWIDVAGMPCEGESAERTGRVPQRDATAVARLRAHGAIVIAKTQPGADHPIHGRCHHPTHRDRSPGGSSSGEAALIGAGASAIGLGSDSGGSIRLPAAWCGVVGLKPSAGLVPTTGHFPRVGYRFDGRTTMGPLAVSVDDAYEMLRCIAGPDGVDPDCHPVPLGAPSSVSVSGMRVAVLNTYGSWKVAGSTHDAVERAAVDLVARGAQIVGGALPQHLDESLEITQRYWMRAALKGRDVDRQLLEWDQFNGKMTRASASFDVVLGPVVADVAPLARPLVGEDYIFTLPWSLTGWPAISIPYGVDAATGLPLAVQIAAPRWHDHVVIAVAKALLLTANVTASHVANDARGSSEKHS